MPRLLVFQHVAAEPLGTLDPLIRKRGHRIRFKNFERHPDAQLNVDRYRGLVVLGGPMNVEDHPRRPHLRNEMIAIERMLEQGKPVLGICLGAQLLAHVLGAPVRRNEVPEIGWYPLRKTTEGTSDPVLAPLQADTPVFVIGGGAAGLMCAMTAGQRGRRVLVIEHANRVGKKILMSGGGRCNFTNTGTTPRTSCRPTRISANRRWRATRRRISSTLVERHGIAYHEKELGQLFCDDSSKQIVGCCWTNAPQAGVRIDTNCAVERVVAGSTASSVCCTALGDSPRRRSSSPPAACRSRRMGASGFGYDAGAQFGHAVLPTRAGLVPLTLTGIAPGTHCRTSAASRCRSRARCNGVRASELRHAGHPPWDQRPGDPADLQLLATRATTCAWTCCRAPMPMPCCATGRPAAATRSCHRAGRSPAEALRPAPVRALDRGATPDAAVQRAELRGIAACCRLATRRQRHRGLSHRGSHPWRRRHRRPVVDHDDVEGHVPGLYFIGEVVDVTGWLGGYNFQWAWASGHAAGQALCG
jgi:GMP synthase-like glutamine amidotransferase